MKRSALTALLASTVIGGSLFAYSVVASNATEKAKTEAAAPAEKTGDYVVIKYDGKEVRKSELEKQWAVMFPGEDAPEFDSFDNNVKLEILKNIARERVVLDKAYAAKVENTDEVKRNLETAKRQFMIQAYLKSQLGNIVSDKDVKKEYDVLVEKYKGKQEVHARHILVESEEEANKLYEDIKKGGDFAELAKANSADKGSGEKGGDLGYFTKERMVPQFADAAFSAKKGEVTKPVKSDFGWHIIEVLDQRDLKAPPFAEVKGRIQESLATPAIERYVNKLFEESKVKFYDADGTELKQGPGLAAGEAELGGQSPIPTDKQ